MICPACGHTNLEGADVCDRCEQSLAFQSKPRPKSNLERSIWKDRLRVLSPRAAMSVAPDMPVGQVLQLLVERGIGCVPVEQDGKVVGIFSERDALMRLNIDAVKLAERPVAQFMTSPADSLDIDDKIAFALHKMDLGGYRHIPVLEQGQLRGVISVRDILRYMTTTILTAELA
jgi:CBS domain-containing protein